MRWIARDPAATGSMIAPETPGTQHGCAHPRSHDFPARDLRGRAGRGPRRLRLRPGRRGGMAARAHTAADREPDHRLRADRAGRRGVEAAPRRAVAPALAVP